MGSVLLLLDSSRTASQGDQHLMLMPKRLRSAIGNGAPKQLHCATGLLFLRVVQERGGIVGARLVVARQLPK